MIMRTVLVGPKAFRLYHRHTLSMGLSLLFNCVPFGYRKQLVSGGEGCTHRFTDLRVVARTTKITYVNSTWC